MGKADKKNKRTTFFFIAAFAAIFIIMFISNVKSSLKKELQFPLNNGVAKLSTYKNSLVAVCLDKQVYIWDWDNLSQKPQSITAESSQALLVEPDLIISIKQSSPKTVIARGFGANKDYKEIQIDSQATQTHLGANRDRTMIVVALEKDNVTDNLKTDYELLQIDLETRINRRILKINEQAPSSLSNVAVSDDGRFVVFTGEKNKHSWMVLVDTEYSKVKWEKEPPGLEKFHSGAFTPDGKYVYARGSDSLLYKIDTSSGTIADTITPIKTNKNTIGQSSVQDVEVSPNGRLVAAFVFDELWVWDCQTGNKLLHKTPGHKIESGLAFSPDSRFLATSDLRQGGTIKIWKMPIH